MEAKQIYTMEKPKYNTKAIMFVLLLGSFISLFNETILNVAFPKLMIEMHITATTAQWLTTGYVLVVGILVPVTAFLIHTFTTKQLFLTAMIIFLIGTICAVFSNTFTALLISRIIQALGTGMLIPIMMNSALVITSPEKRGSIMGLCACIITLGPALGPTVSGLLLQHFNWHSLFILLIPILLICIIGGYIYLENISVITKPKIDYLSILLSSIGFAGIIYSVSSASTSSLSSTAATFLIGIIALIFFGKRQLSLKQPILEIRSFKHPVFAIGTLLIILMQMFNFSINVILPLLLQNGLNTSSFTSAMAILPPILLGCVLTPFVGKIYDKIGGNIIIPLGFAVSCIFTFVLSHISPSTPISTITLIYCAIMIGISMSMPTSQTTALSELPGKNQADGVAIVNTAMQLAGALGSALFVGIMTTYQNIYLKNVNYASASANQANAIYSGFNHSTTIAALLIGIGFIFSLILSKKNRVRNNEN